MKKDPIRKEFQILLIVFVVVVTLFWIFLFLHVFFQPTTVFLQPNEVNKNVTEGKLIIHLTDEDFREFPELESLIRDGQDSIIDGKEWDRYKNKYSTHDSVNNTVRYLEYNGRYYWLAIRIHTGEQ